MAMQAAQRDIQAQPGNRFRATDSKSPLPTSELVVDRLVRDDLGMLHVVLRDLEFREISLFVEQFEAAIASGYLVPDDQPLRILA